MPPAIRDIMRKGRRSLWEVVVVAVIVVLTVIMGAAIYARRAEAEKGRLLMRELMMLRSSLIVYMIVNRERAPSLKELQSRRYEVEGVVLRYSDELPLSADGEVIDPFGNPYRYDPKTGWISSATGGFEHW
jgi:hypothetical protein